MTLREVIASRIAAFATRERILRYPAVMFATVTAVALADRALGHGLIGRSNTVLGNDFLAFYAAGKLVLLGRQAELYDFNAQSILQAQISGRTSDLWTAWLSPPVLALFFVPFAALPYAAALATFLALSGALAVLSFRTFARTLPGSPPLGTLIAAALGFYPTLQFIIGGQMSAVWLALYLAVFLALRRERDTLAGALLGCFACKPPLALGLGVALVVARRFRALAAAVATASVFLALGAALLPQASAAYREAAPGFHAYVRAPGYPTAGLYGAFELPTLILDGFSPRAGTTLGVLTTIALLVATGVVWRRLPWRPGTPEWDLALAATLVFGLLASPHVFCYDLTLLLAPFFVVAARLSTTGARRDGLVAATVVVWLFGLIGTFVTALEQTLSKALFGVSIAMQFGFLAIAYWGYAIARCALDSSSSGNGGPHPELTE